MLIAGTSEFIYFCLVLMRMTGFVMFNPVFGRRNVPAMFRIGLSLILAVTVYSTQSQEGMQGYEMGSAIEWGLYLVKEFLCGYVLGYVMSLFEFVVTGAGAVIDFEIGLSMSTVYDPQNGTQLAMTGQIMQIYYMLLFFAVDGHLSLMKIFLTSGQVVPYGHVVIGQMQADAVLALFTECVVMLVKLAFPVIAIEFLTEIAMGMLIRIIPQINLFALNIEIKVVVGVLVLFLLMSPVGSYLNELAGEMIVQAGQILKVLKG